MQAITPFLWFDNQAEEALNFYLSVFPDARVLRTARFPKGGPGPEGELMTVHFELNGVGFIALNGGPRFTFNESVSFVVNCETQEEIDDKWNKLTADGGMEQPCGWVKDKFGLSWQVVPPLLGKFMADADPEKAQRVMQAMLAMKKIIIADLQKAYEGK